MTATPNDVSVTQWLSRLKAGDHAAAQPIWTRYFEHMQSLARVKLRAMVSLAQSDEEDVALSAFKSFCRGVDDGRFPVLTDRDELWPLLVVLTERKAIDLVRRSRALKRGGGATPGDLDAEKLIDPAPSPDVAASLVDECNRWLDRLGDPVLKAVATMRIDGGSIEDIAAQMGVGPRTVERKLSLIRKIWEAAAREIRE